MRKIIGPNWTIIPPTPQQLQKDKEENGFISFSSSKFCKICGTEFDYSKKGGVTKAICGLCVVDIKCPICNKHFNLDLHKYSGQQQIKIIEAISKKENINLACSSICKVKMRNITMTSQGICTVCGKEVNKRSSSGMCKDCQTKHNNKLSQRNSKPGNCVICKKFSKIRNGAGICNSCINKQFSNGICTVCGQVTTTQDQFGRCIKCHNEFYQSEKFIENSKINGIKNIIAYNTSEVGRQKSIKTMIHTMKEMNNFAFKGIQCNSNCKNYSVCINKDRPKNKWGWCKESPNFKSDGNPEILAEFRIFESNISCNPKCKNFDTCINKDRSKNQWGWCKESPNLASYFNREEFYSTKYDITTFESVEEMISDFNALLGVSGVWTVKCGDQVLDVCETQDIGNEMYQTVRRLHYMKGKTDDEIQSMNVSYNRRKVRDIANEGKLDFVLVARDIDDKSEREKIEARYAHDTKAKYWSPAPNQQITN